MIVMDYVNRRRLKLLGRLRFAALGEAVREIESAVQLPDYRARVERVAVFDVEAFDWNCPQHIMQRFTAEQLEAVVKPLRARITQLESELSAMQRRAS